MSAWSHIGHPGGSRLNGVAPYSHLTGTGGELVSVRVSTDPRALEDLLECLALLSFPINPEIFHGIPTVVQFPAWEKNLGEVREALRDAGFENESLAVSSMLETISS